MLQDNAGRQLIDDLFSFVPVMDSCFDQGLLRFPGGEPLIFHDNFHPVKISFQTVLEGQGLLRALSHTAIQSERQSENNQMNIIFFAYLTDPANSGLEIDFIFPFDGFQG